MARNAHPVAPQGIASDASGVGVNRLETVFGVLASLVALGIALKCSATAQAVRPDGSPTFPLSTSERALRASTPTPGATDGGARRSLGIAESATHERGSSEAHRYAGPLRRFHEALDALAEGRRSDHVRIVWLGDSHTAADIWTHTVRSALQEQYGSGGPGFVHVGLKGQTHTQMTTELKGKWHAVPTQPSRISQTLDGVFGLAGRRFAGEPGSSVTAELRSGVLLDRVQWQLRYRLPARGEMRVTVGPREKLVVGPPVAQDDAPIQEAVVEGLPEETLEIQALKGTPQLFGVIAEGGPPGVVLDTCGVNGARAKTVMAWEELSWIGELRARRPELVVMAYGTNEVYEQRDPGVYQEHIEELVDRVRRAAPEADCLVIGPTDVQNRDGSPNTRTYEIAAAQRIGAEGKGCGYVAAYELMGGKGSYAAWQTQKPPLAGRDGVHLTAHGYRELGRRTIRVLLDRIPAAPLAP